MKTKLLYLASFMLVLITSCSVEETTDQLSEQEKELKVENLVKLFVEDVVPSSSYSKFINDLQTKSSSGLTEEELNQMEQEFLSTQSEEFLELYYFVVNLNLTEDELREVVIAYFSFTKSNSNASKDSDDDCTNAENGPQTSFLSILGRILCEISNYESTGNN
ncbi:hypothetical protein SAMN04487910_2490 [Aquimarina amphilecti]|uniref:Lipoprotein n=1 Tax=Aquimarina amphilecti TaxID=1038014 RepID=A0A1H7QAK5_AQUAM|nr:hypothetical protein [Aquimarina amphilecti]SEL45002.1 hypothetical protein SAMN04487910_2490 [Aquimarina amphilecti]